MAVTVNYDDKRFDQVETDKQQAMTELEKTYAGMIDKSDGFYQQQIDATKEWADKQSALQQEQTDFTIEQIEQQKDKAHKDYVKEQSGAYVDWQKQSDQYGAIAEQQAAAGMTNTGFSESSQVSMYNTYQNRVVAAREIFNQAILNYNNGIKEAQLQNNAALAEIHLQALQQQLELALEGFQYKNSLILEQANKKVELDNQYYQRYQDVLQQINTENAMAEEIRQFNQNYNLQLKQLNEEIRQYNQSYNEQVRQFNEEMARLKKKDEQEYALQIQQIKLQQQQLAEQKRQHDAEVALKKAQLAEEKRQHDAEVALKKAQLAEDKRQFDQQKTGVSSKKVYSSGSGSKSSSGKNSSSSSSVNKISSGASSGSTTSNYQSAYKYISAMITAGRNKNQVLSEIAMAQKAGALTAAEAAKLRATFNPRGHQYT